MAWTTKVLKVLGEYRNKEGVLKSKWEVLRVESDNGGHFDGVQKTGFYLKDGSETRGFSQMLSEYDLDWLVKNRPAITAAMAKKEEAAKPEEQALAAAANDELEETPF